MVPLTMKMRYKGFRCIVEPNYFYETGTLAFGRKDGDAFYQSAQVQESMNKIGKYLNLKSHSVKGRVATDSAGGEILISQRMQITTFPKLSFEDLVIQNNERFKFEINKLKIGTSKFL